MAKKDKWQKAFEEIIHEAVVKSDELAIKLSKEGKLTGLDTENELFKPIDDEAKRKIAELKKQYEKETKKELNI